MFKNLLLHGYSSPSQIPGTWDSHANCCYDHYNKTFFKIAGLAPIIFITKIIYVKVWINENFNDSFCCSTFAWTSSHFRKFKIKNKNCLRKYIWSATFINLCQIFLNTSVYLFKPSQATGLSVIPLVSGSLYTSWVGDYHMLERINMSLAFKGSREGGLYAWINLIKNFLLKQFQYQ